MLVDRIQTLESRHNMLEHQIHEERAHPYWDEIEIARLKHERLELEDEIMRLQKQSDH